MLEASKVGDIYLFDHEFVTFSQRVVCQLYLCRYRNIHRAASGKTRARHEAALLCFPLKLYRACQGIAVEKGPRSVPGTLFPPRVRGCATLPDHHVDSAPVRCSLSRSRTGALYLCANSAPPLIDSHVHVWKHDPAFPFAAGAHPTPEDATAEMLLDLMRANDVARTVIIQVIHYVGTTAIWPAS